MAGGVSQETLEVAKIRIDKLRDQADAKEKSALWLCGGSMLQV